MVFFEDFKSIPNSGLSRFPFGVSVSTQWQAKHQRSLDESASEGKGESYASKKGKGAWNDRDCRW